MSEKYIENKCNVLAKNEGWANTKLYKNGYPDRLYLKMGKLFFVEFKKIGGNLTKLQKISIDNLKKNKFSVYIINNVNDFKKILEIENLK